MRRSAGGIEFTHRSSRTTRTRTNSSRSAGRAHDSTADARLPEAEPNLTHPTREAVGPNHRESALRSAFLLRPPHVTVVKTIHELRICVDALQQLILPHFIEIVGVETETFGDTNTDGDCHPGKRNTTKDNRQMSGVYSDN